MLRTQPPVPADNATLRGTESVPAKLVRNLRWGVLFDESVLIQRALELQSDEMI